MSVFVFYIIFFYLFFFKQKTAYEMRISDWSSDVCSSDLALDLTLDSLRRMKDPTEREAAAVALFGTQAEDLGAALFELDPSSATKKLGDVGGAAKKADRKSVV